MRLNPSQGIQQIVRRINEHAIGGYHAGLKRDGHAWYAKSGAWRAEHKGSTGRLYHYTTQMLEWQYNLTTLPATITITRIWIGHGSASDQTGVNGALSALNSRLHYYRDSKGGGPRVNPYSISAGVGGSVRSVSPPVYNPRRRRRR